MSSAAQKCDDCKQFARFDDPIEYYARHGAHLHDTCAAQRDDDDEDEDTISEDDE